MKKIAAIILACATTFSSLGAVASTSDVDNLLAAAQKEGRVDSLAMPDSWANWKDTWDDLKSKYGIEHSDTDMSSAQEIAKFLAEKNNASGDIGDVGAAFGPIAVQKGVAQPYKTSTWDQIPNWAKDKDGNWVLAYTGTIAFIVNKNLVKDIPHSWADLLKGKYTVAVGEVGNASQASSGVLAAAYAMGGSEKDLTPAIKFFAELAKQGRLSLTNPKIASLEKDEIEVGIVWDFNGLNYRDQIDKDRFEVLIPSDGTITSGYTTIINKYAKHPNAAKFAREYILSDAGQINLAKGYARPIRSASIVLPDEVKAKLLPDSQYVSAKPIADYEAWEKSSKTLPRQWQESVIMNMK